MTPRHCILAALLAAALAVAGCGGGSDSSSDDGGGAAKPAAGAIALAADPGGAIKFDKKSLSAKAGAVTIDFENASQTPHAVEIEGKGETKTITGGSATLKADLKPGTYTYYCPVVDHREEGMEGTLTVK